MGSEKGFREDVVVICGWVWVAFYKEVAPFWLAEVGGRSNCCNKDG